MIMEPLLRVDDIQTYLGESHILQGVSLEAQAGEVVWGGDAADATAQDAWR